MGQFEQFLQLQRKLGVRVGSSLGETLKTLTRKGYDVSHGVR